MRPMAATRMRSATTWLEGLGEWSWPGCAPVGEISPAAWVPALPVRVEAPALRRAPAARRCRARCGLRASRCWSWSPP